MLEKIEKGTKVTQIHLGQVGDIDLFASIPFKEEKEFDDKKGALLQVMSDAFEYIQKQIKPKRVSKERKTKKK
jgi:hypothetical protein